MHQWEVRSSYFKDKNSFSFPHFIHAEGGKWVEEKYRASEANDGVLTPDTFPINTHGGLLGFGAPWETPAMFNIIEAVHQMRRTAGKALISFFLMVLTNGCICCCVKLLSSLFDFILYTLFYITCIHEIVFLS